MYGQEFNPAPPGCFLLVLDQSYSMEEPFGGDTEVRRCDGLAEAVNNWLANLVIRATGTNGIKDWMHVGVIGYRTDDMGQAIIENSLPSASTEHPLIPISQIVDDETGELTLVKMQRPIWVAPVAEGGTPMCQALEHAYLVLQRWVAEHSNSFPPVLIHITDGEAMDGDPIPYAEAIRSLRTDDGTALLLNCDISYAAASPIMFPSSDDNMPEYLAKTLFLMSSVLPEPMRQMAEMDGFELQSDARGMAYNAGLTHLVKFLDVVLPGR